MRVIAFLEQLALTHPNAVHTIIKETLMSTQKDYVKPNRFQLVAQIEPITETDIAAREFPIWWSEVLNILGKYEEIFGIAGLQKIFQSFLANPSQILEKRSDHLPIH